MKRLILTTLLSLSWGTIILTTSQQAEASRTYKTTPTVTRGFWNAKWIITPTLSSNSDLYVYRRSVNINKHVYKLSYAKKTSKNHFIFHLKKHKPVQVFYKIRTVGNRKDVKTVSLRVDSTNSGYDGLFYKGNLWNRPYKDTNFLTFDADYNNGLPFDYIRITGKTLPNATVTFSNGGETVAHKDGTFTLSIHRQGKLMIGKSVTVTSTRLSAKRVYQKLTVTTDPDGDDYDQSDYDSNGTFDYTSDYF